MDYYLETEDSQENGYTHNRSAVGASASSRRESVPYNGFDRF